MQNIHGSRSPLLIVAFEEHKTPIVFTSAGERTARVRHANAALPVSQHLPTCSLLTSV